MDRQTESQNDTSADRQSQNDKGTDRQNQNDKGTDRVSQNDTGQTDRVRTMRVQTYRESERYGNRQTVTTMREQTDRVRTIGGQTAASSSSIP